MRFLSKTKEETFSLDSEVMFPLVGKQRFFSFLFENQRARENKYLPFSSA